MIVLFSKSFKDFLSDVGMLLFWECLLLSSRRLSDIFTADQPFRSLLCFINSSLWHSVSISHISNQICLESNFFLMISILSFLFLQPSDLSFSKLGFKQIIRLSRFACILSSGELLVSLKDLYSTLVSLKYNFVDLSTGNDFQQELFGNCFLFLFNSGFVKNFSVFRV